MNEAERQRLLQRNARIIEAVKQKAQAVCPGAVELISVAGSFGSGDFYEKSDLDLLIVVGSSEGWKISRCFILGDVAHDLYCHTWEQLEEMAAYHHPHVIKLMQPHVVYSSGDGALQRYRQLHEKLVKTLCSPLDSRDLEKAKAHFHAALQAFAGLFLEDALGRCQYRAAWFLQAIEYTLYLLNKEYIRHGIRGIPEELCALKLLPVGFRESYFALIHADSVSKLRQAAKTLAQNTEALLAEVENEISPKRPADAQALRGSYEEIYSNWKNKMHRAAQLGDCYLSLMSAASCQAFYDEMFKAYDIGRYDLFKAPFPGSLDQAAQDFDRTMESYRELYERAALKPARYETLEEFLEDYLK